MKSLVDVNLELDNIRKKIDSFNTDERKEIKKNNKIIDNDIMLLNDIKKKIYNEIKDRYIELIPKEDNSKKNDVKNIDMVRYLSNNSYIYKMNIDKNLYEIRYSNSIDIINDNIIDLINKFLLTGITLKKEDFNYSLSLYKYMSDFLMYRDSDDFNKLMKESFDELYWECPNIVSHIYLCFMLLLDKNKDKFDSYIKSKYSDTGDYDKEIASYYQNIINDNEKLMSNSFYWYQLFLNGDLRIDDYLSDSSHKKEIISKFIDYDKYMDKNNEDISYFYEQIKGIKNDLCESLWISRYSYIIDKVKEIYQNKGNYMNNYATFVKDIKTMNKDREKLNKKLFAIYGKLNEKNNDRLMKKYNNLFNKSNSKIDEIINIYKDYDDVIFNNEVITKLNDDSTYYDVFKLVEGNYSYLIKIMDKSGSYDDYLDFMYSPFLNICKSIPFISEVSIEDKLMEKYDLFDIDINLSDKSKLKEDLEYIIRVSYLDKYKIKIDDYKLIFDIKKMIDDEDRD